MKTTTFSARSGFTLVELMVGMTIGIIVSAMAISYIRTSAILLAKNISANQSNNELRNALDQIGERIHGALTMPVLIDTTGNVLSSLPSSGSTGDSQAAAGVAYDRLLGDPYVLIYPGGNGLSAADNSVSVERSLSIYASAPVPAEGDVLLIDSAPPAMRAQISTVNEGAASGNTQSINLTFTTAFGSDIPWNSSQPKLARLIRREALLVMKIDERLELRRYPLFEPKPDLNKQSNYRVISRNIGNRLSETTPFFITTANMFGDRLFKLDLRVRVTGYENVLATKEVNEFSNFMRVRTVIPVRNRPR